ncbi:hypothetical protein [Kitasatospora sp. NBC_00315]|uniref:hypothetical protein n=1 Tax=Kitasatospora sp. NBC_00315 TaxID=2975963 RepID=UPI00324FC1CC
MTDAKTPAQLASAAADAVQALNHATFNTSYEDGGWWWPSDAYDVVGGLDRMAGMLGQALDQIAAHVERLAQHDHIRSDKGGDGGEDVATALRALKSAQADAARLASHLGGAHSALSSLAYKD